MHEEMYHADDEQFWRAFCYVIDEQTPDEARRFEAQLAVDQKTREAVAAAVQLLEAVRVEAVRVEAVRVEAVRVEAVRVEAVTAEVIKGAPLPELTRVAKLTVSSIPRAGRFWSSPAGWAALATAACLAFVMFSLVQSNWRILPQAQPAPPTPADLTRSDLASAWAGSFADADAAGDMGVENESVATDDDEELLVSPWLFEAVTARAEGNPATDDAPTDAGHTET